MVDLTSSKSSAFVNGVGEMRSHENLMYPWEWTSFGEEKA